MQLLRRAEIGFGGYDAWVEQVFAEEARNAQRLDAKLRIEEHWLLRGVTARRARNEGRKSKLMEMRALRASDAPEAAQAIRLFIHRILREIGALAAVMGGIDGIVFTAGIGENDAATRTEVAAGCAWLGAEIDPAKNAARQTELSTPASRIRLMMIPTDEELNIAKSTIALVAAQTRAI